MYDGKKNKKSGVIAITLPPTECTYYTAAHEGENNLQCCTDRPLVVRFGHGDDPPATTISFVVTLDVLPRWRPLHLPNRRTVVSCRRPRGVRRVMRRVSASGGNAATRAYAPATGRSTRASGTDRVPSSTPTVNA